MLKIIVSIIGITHLVGCQVGLKREKKYEVAHDISELRTLLEKEYPPIYIKIDFEDLSNIYEEVIKEIDPEFKKILVSQWDVSKVTSMERTFALAYSFNQPLEDWDVSNVTDMSGMFYFANSFNQPLNNWDVSSVTNMHGMFDESGMEILPTWYTP